MNLADMFLHVAALNPERTALMEDGQSVTYQQLVDDASRLAGALRHQGVEPGDRVALLGAPTVALATYELACVATGAIPVVVYNPLAPVEAHAIVRDADPRLAIVGVGAEDQLAALHVPTLQWTQRTPADATSFRRLHPTTQPEPRFSWHRAKPDDVALIIYTGGTTGRPKGVMHTHASVLSWMSMSPPHGWGSSAENYRCLIANMAHVSGQHNLWSTFAQGGSGVLPGPAALTAERWVELVERFRIVYAGLLGRLCHDVLHLPGLSERDLSSVKLVSCGGAPVPPDTLRQLVEFFAGATVVEGYSQTETGITITLANLTKLIREGADNSRLCTVGKPDLAARSGQLPQEVRVVSPDGRDVGPCVPGEVVCRGPQVMAGYWGNPEASAEVLRDGWLHTGDIGHVDEGGSLYLDGRLKDVIKVDSLSVYPTEVEVVIAAHPCVDDVTVVGVPIAEGGEALVAVVVPVDDCTVDLDELRTFCQTSLAVYKLPTQLFLVDRLPRSVNHKVLKRDLRSLIQCS